MNWVSRKIHLYNVTMGLYMLDWWERYLFNEGIGNKVWDLFQILKQNLLTYWFWSCFGSSATTPPDLPPTCMKSIWKECFIRGLAAIISTSVNGLVKLEFRTSDENILFA
ncbi:hypothetical protein FCM35_KLT05909 [Carex littledalei]|uniref:Uncharacterized protein n=1 Tax=Carex littledalei TaxID=544730 RepID=A0A833QWB8_9POAL|nr:hypothetical protein FCM35_KLT05909 [Carex littledalei]